MIEIIRYFNLDFMHSQELRGKAFFRQYFKFKLGSFDRIKVA